jgi:hypothetical protein
MPSGGGGTWRRAAGGSGHCQGVGASTDREGNGVIGSDTTGIEVAATGQRSRQGPGLHSNASVTLGVVQKARFSRQLQTLTLAGKRRSQLRCSNTPSFLCNGNSSAMHR